MADKILIRDTRNGQTAPMSPQMLDHPHWAEFFEEVRTDKPVAPELHKPRKAQKKRLTEPAADELADEATESKDED